MKNPSSKFWVAVIFSTIVGIHAIRLLSTITPVALSETWPLTESAHFIDAVESKRMGRILDQTKQFKGIDFQNYAGYHTGDVLKSDRRGVVLISTVLRHLFDPAQSIKFLIYFMYLIIPLFIFWATKLFIGDIKACLVAMAISVAGFSTFEPFSWKLIHLGDHAFIFGSSLSVLVVALFYRLVQKPNLFFLIMFALTGLVLNLFQVKLFFILIIPLMAILIVINPKLNREDKIYISLGLTFLIYLGVRYFWMYYEIHNYSELWYEDRFRSTPYDLIQLFWPQDKWSSLPNSLIRIFLVISMIEGIALLKAKKNKLGLMFSIWGGFLFLLAFAGSYMPVFSEWGPRRFVLTFSVFQIVPASLFLATVFLKSESVGRWLFMAVVWFQLTYPLAGYDPNYNLKSDERENYLRVIEKIDSINPEGRILFEDHNDSYVVSQMLQVLTDYNLVGPANRLVSDSLANPDFSTARSFAPRILYGRPYESYDEKELVDLIKILNVSHIFTFSVQAEHLFNQYPRHFDAIVKSTFAPVNVAEMRRTLENQGHPGRFSIPPEWKLFQIFRVKNFKNDYFVKGKGDIQTHPNQMTLDNLSSGELVMKFRYLDDLVSEPSVDISSSTISHSPFPLLTVNNKDGHKKIVIRAKGIYD